MEDYKGNSNKDKVVTEAVAPITTGTVKKRFKSSIISDDAGSVGKHLKEDILVPSIKKLITDVFKNAIDGIIYGSRGNPNAQARTSGSVSYSSYYNRPTYSTPSYAAPIGVGGFVLDLIELNDRGTAEVVLQRLRDDLSRYGCISCAAYYELVNVSAPFTANDYGWRDLSQAYVERRPNGAYSIVFPRIQSLK